MSDSATTLSHMSHCDARRVGGGRVCLLEWATRTLGDHTKGC